MHDRIEAVFERLEIVWPPAAADRRPACRSGTPADKADLWPGQARSTSAPL
jgi:hypothetical protein